MMESYGHTMETRLPAMDGMSRTPSGKAEFIREYNRWLVANLLRREGPLSRAKLAESLGLSAPAVSRIVETLIEEGYVVEIGVAETPIGRRPRLLEVQPNAGVALGIDLRHVRKAEVGLVNLTGELIASRSANLGVLHPSPGKVVETVGKLARSILKDVSIGYPAPLAAGVACPGVIDSKSGEIEYSAHLGWQNVPLRSLLQQELGLGVFVDTDCNAPALAESWLGAGVSSSHLVYLTFGPGLGIGMVIDGQVYRGASGIAGEMGHTVVQIEGGKRCRCGNYGCAETFLSDDAILELAAVEQSRNNSILPYESVSDIFHRANQGEETAAHIVDCLSCYFEAVIVNVANLLNPEVLVIDGWPDSVPMLVSLAERTLAEKALPLVGRDVRVTGPSLGDKTVLVGAAMLVIERFWQAPVFDVSRTYHELTGTRSIGSRIPVVSR